ncbi:MOSC domain-containing protein [Fluviibacterium sp. DFM31]|uniref:MOSC domain-containing protein n=1 Tax=Meridianimarinicoccus marinus TaxID=3231483 RepID=A0ABV3L617_9RHOB
MTHRLAAIWRHPIKGIGAEPLETTRLTPDRPLPGDRAWAVLTGGATDTGAWQPCRNFARGCYGPELMAITARTTGNRIHLSHPRQADLIVDPATEGPRLIDWLRPLYPAERPAPTQVVKAPPEGMSDAPFPSVAILGRAALDALGEVAGQALDMRRFRGNLWLDGLAPFEELDWVGRTLRIGSAELRVDERITRCRATETNPDTGTHDVTTLHLLRRHWGHIDFGVKAVVTKPGAIGLGDAVELLG